jgi:uncharacterized membrane protein required for colicin V production
VNWLDILLLVLIGITATAGYRIGLVQAATLFAGTLIGIVLASRLHDNVDVVFSQLTENENAQELGGYILVFAAILLASLVTSWLIRMLFRTLLLGWVDKLGGFALGTIIALATGSAFLANVQDFPILDLERAIENSATGSFLADNFDVVLRGLLIIPKDYGTLVNDLL